jgi:hypothetical protein
MYNKRHATCVLAPQKHCPPFCRVCGVPTNTIEFVQLAPRDLEWVYVCRYSLVICSCVWSMTSNNALYAIPTLQSGVPMDDQINRFLISVKQQTLPEPAHVTVLYGPPQPSTDPDPTPDDMYAMFGWEVLHAWALGVITGVGIYQHPHRGMFIVHLEVWSEQLTNLRATLLKKFPEAAATLARQDADLAAAAATSWPGIYDTSFTTLPDAPWAHITLCTLPTLEEAQAIAAKAKAFFFPSGKPDVLTVTFSSYVGLSAISGMPTILHVRPLSD